MKMVAPPAAATSGAHPSTSPNNASPSSPSPFMKLFGPDQVDGLRYIRPLSHIREKIYKHVWSRERRDQEKLDWVVSPSGFNRNVPERFIPDTPYGSDAFHPDRLAKLPCNLHLVNKQISKDFLQHIYLANSLEIDLDLQAIHTQQGEASFQKLLTLLQNPNFQEHTQSARLRIHFPAKYPFNNLPAFNKQILDKLAAIFDTFQAIGDGIFRVVLSQGEPFDYELPLALFPFMRLRMQNWVVDTLNDTIFPYKWDRLKDQGAYKLHKAYESYVVRRLLGDPAPPYSMNQINQQLVRTQPARSANPPPIMATNKTGSQKKKARKQKLVAEALLAATSSPVDKLTASFNTIETPSASSLGTQPSGAEISVAQTSAIEAIGDDMTADVEVTNLAGTVADEVTHKPNAASADPPSPPLTPAQPCMIESQAGSPSVPSILTQSRLIESQAVSLASSTDDDSPAILTPSGSSRHATSPTNNNAPPPSTTDNEITNLQSSRPPSPALSSVTLDLEDEAQITSQDAHGEDVGLSSGALQPANQDEPKKQPKKKRKKSKKSKTTATRLIHAQTDNASARGVVHQDQLSKEASDEGLGSTHSSHEVAVADQSTTQSSATQLGDYELSVTPLLPSHVWGRHRQTGEGVVIPRNATVERFLRQQERLQKVQAQKEADQKQVRDKRQARKAKQLLLGRGGNVVENSPLSRAMIRPREISKKAAAEKGGEELGAEFASGTEFETGVDLVFTNLSRRDFRNVRSQSAEMEMVEARRIDHSELVLRDNDDLQRGEHRFDFPYASDDDGDVDSTVQGYVQEITGAYFSDGEDDPERHWEDEPYDSAEDVPVRSRVHSDAATYEEDNDSQDLDMEIPASGPTAQDQVYYRSDLSNGSAMEDYQAPQTARSHDSLATGAPASATLDRASPDHEILDSEGVDIQGRDHATFDRAEFDIGEPQNSNPTSDDGQAKNTKGGNDWMNTIKCYDCGEMGHPRRHCPHPKSHSGFKRGGGRREFRSSDSRGPSNNSTSAHTTRNAWAALVQSGDEALQVANRARRVELEQEMKAEGTDYSDYAGPINDNWIKTDEDGQCIKGATEQVIYGTQSQDCVSTDSLGAIQEAGKLQEAEKSGVDEQPLETKKLLGAQQQPATQEAKAFEHQPVLHKSEDSQDDEEQPVFYECKESQDDGQ